MEDNLRKIKIKDDLLKPKKKMEENLKKMEDNLKKIKILIPLKFWGKPFDDFKKKEEDLKNKWKRT
jgi:hypothetical protein